MKKFLKIFSIVLVVLFAAILILPYAFRGKITEIVKEEINNSVNAQVDFSGVNLSLIRRFPNFSVRITDISILGNEPFENDTLLYTKSFELTLDIMSVFRGSPYEIKDIQIREPYIQLLVLEDGRQNWAITLGEEEPEEPVITDDEDEAFDFGIGLRSFRLRDARVVYNDQAMPFYADADKINATLSGNFSLDRTQLQLALDIGAINSDFDGMTLLKDVSFKAKTAVDADLANDTYTVETNDLYLNALEMAMAGRFSLDDSDIGIDFTFDAPNGTFKQLLSLVPPEFMKDYADIEAAGDFSLSAFLNGTYSNDTFPAFGVKLNVDNGSVGYPDLPDKLENIRLALNVDNETGNFDDTFIEINPLRFSMLNNPFEMSLAVKNPESDPLIDSKMKGKLVLERLAAFLPEDAIANLSGEIDMDFALNTALSAVEEGRYNDVKAGGQITLNGFTSKLEEQDAVLNIERAGLSFSPQAVNTEIQNMQLGNSDFNFSGQITDYLGYFLSDGELKGEFKLSSNLIDASEMMEKFTSDDTTAITLDFLPERVNMRFDATAGTIKYAQFELKQAKAGITYIDKKITFDPLQASMMGGQLGMSGYLDGNDAASPEIDFSFNIDKFDIPTAYETIGLFQAAAPIAKNAKGTFSTGFKLKGKLDEELSPVFSTLQGGGGLSSSRLQIDSVPAMDQLASLLGNDDYKQLTTNALDLNFEFVNGRVFQKPFTLGYAGSDVTMSGSMGFDQSLDYDLIFKVPFGKLGDTVKDGISSLIGGAGAGISPGNEVQVKALVTGTATSPKISLDYKDYAKDLKNDLTRLAQDKLNEEKAALEAKVRQEAQQLIDEARKQGDKLTAEADAAANSIRSEAEKAAARLRSEAAKEADRLEAEGKKKGVLAERLAKEAAKKVRDEAEKKAAALEREADSKASALQDEARSKADALVKEAEKKAGN